MTTEGDRAQSPTQDILERQLASGASNRDDNITDQPRSDDITSRDTGEDKIQPPLFAREPEEDLEDLTGKKINENDPNFKPDSGRDNTSGKAFPHTEAGNDDTATKTRAPPEGRELSPTTERDPRQLTVLNKGDVDDDNDDNHSDNDGDNDDGGWGGNHTLDTNIDKTEDELSHRPRRAILQGTSRTNENEQVSPQPMSNNLVVKNGRVPASWQQSTVFKTVKMPRPSPRVHGSKLQSKSDKAQKQTERPTVQTTLRADEFARRTNALVKKKTKTSFSKSETNYVRLAKIVAKVGSDLLRLAFFNYMERQQPPKKLYQFLSANKRRLKNAASTYELISKRWDIMYPDDDETKADIQQLDPALLFWFLRHICSLKRPNDFIWKRKPLAEDVSETADIARIRDVRNFLINLSVPALYDEEFDRKVNKFKEVAMRLTGEKRGPELLAIVEAMKTEQVRSVEREQFLGVLNRWADDTDDRRIAPAKQGGENIKERKEMTMRFLQRHRNPKVFVRTKIFQRAQDKLSKHGCVILKGSIGDGKTTTGIALMVAMFDEDECLLVTSPDQWAFIDPRTVSVVLLDDIFGSGSYDEDLLQRWETKFQQIYSTSRDTDGRTGVRIIITIRQNVFDQCYNKLTPYPLFSKDKILDCSTSEILITERRLMLARHVSASEKDLSKNEIDKASKSHNSKLGFPQCCALCVSKDPFLLIGSQFFERPIEVLFEHIDRMYDGDKYSYLGLVLLMFQKDGVLFKKNLKDFKEGPFKTRFMDIAFLCHVPNSDHLGKFTLQALEKHIDSYVNYYKDRQCYTFSHESVNEAVMASFGERHPQEVLEGCSLSLLLDFVGTDDNFEGRKDEIFMMRVRPENFAILAKVFVHYINNGEVKKIIQHRAMKDLRFITFLFEYIKQQRENGELIILSQDKTVPPIKKVDKKRRGFLYYAIDQDVPNVELVDAILKTGMHVQKAAKDKWCIAELEASIYMAVKRGSYDIYKAIIETGLEPPDDLMYEEQYLTSVDIMRDLLSRKVWSSEQKDIALVRACRGVKQESQEIVTLLLQDNVAINSIRMGTTALCEAVKSGRLKTVMLLLTSGASVDDRDATQQTPLHHACDWNNIEVVKILLKKHADVNARDGLGFTPLLVAAGWGRETIVELLLPKRVNPLVMDDQENTILHICAANGQAKVIRMLLVKFPKEMESLLIFRNRHGWTPLDFALRCGHLDATKLLIGVILKTPNLKTQSRTFVHTRFFVVKLEDFNVDEKFQYRFLDENNIRTCYQMPRCNWFIQAGTRDEYEAVRSFSTRYESKLRQCLAKN
ncbi:hypothetical protein ACF0H5_023962 [Mactra antiquata]